MVNIQEIILQAKENGHKKYEEFVRYTNGDRGNRMIIFIAKTLHTRTVTNWGRDEDEDLYIGLDEAGWIQYTHKIQSGDGPLQIYNPSVKRLGDDDVFAYLVGPTCENEDYMAFMHTAHRLLF